MADARVESLDRGDLDVEIVSPLPVETRGVADQGSGHVQEQVHSGDDM